VPVIIDRLSGKTQAAQIFVAVLGASNFTYAEASWTQGLGRLDRCPHASLCRHWRRAQAAGAGQHQVAVINACLYEPQVNRSYAEMAAHYDTAILRPGRAGRATRRKSKPRC